jgi:hypothetical protein
MQKLGPQAFNLVGKITCPRVLQLYLMDLRQNNPAQRWRGNAAARLSSVPLIHSYKTTILSSLLYAEPYDTHAVLIEVSVEGTVNPNRTDGHEQRKVGVGSGVLTGLLGSDSVCDEGTGSAGQYGDDGAADVVQ